MDAPAIFISYSKRDTEWKNRLKGYLKVLETQHIATLWSDDRISPGTSWNAEIIQALEKATIVVLLVSEDSLGSEYIQHREMSLALKARLEKDLLIFPILLRDCPWQAVEWLRETSLFPMDDKGRPRPLSSYTGEDLNKVLSEAVLLIHEALLKNRERGKRPATRYGNSQSLARLCNRDDQEDDFADHLRRSAASKKPHFCFVHGHEKSGHHSLLRRLIDRVILPEGKGADSSEQGFFQTEIQWPNVHPLEWRKWTALNRSDPEKTPPPPGWPRLRSSLLNAFVRDARKQPDARSDRWGSQEFAQVIREWGAAYGTVALVHFIPASGHPDATLRLLDAYFAFWDTFASNDPSQHFVLFFCFPFPEPKWWQWSRPYRRRDKAFLNMLSLNCAARTGELPSGCAAVELPQLDKIRRHHVLAWFRKLELGSEAFWNSCCDRIFAQSEALHMVEIEECLIKIHRAYLETS